MGLFFTALLVVEGMVKVGPAVLLGWVMCSWRLMVCGSSVSLMRTFSGVRW